MFIEDFEEVNKSKIIFLVFKNSKKIFKIFKMIIYFSKQKIKKNLYSRKVHT